jgi:AcrR family transcriptional regulator
VSQASSRRPSASPPRRRDEARALFRNAILEAAEAVFAERGFHRSRIQDVAERARIAVGTVYNHFDEKEDLLRALLEERTEELVSELERQPADPTDFEGSLTARIERMFRYVDGHRTFFAIAAEQGAVGSGSTSATDVGGKAARSVARARAVFVSIAEEGVAQGFLDPDIHPQRLARALGGLIRAFTLGAIEDGRSQLVSDAPLVVRLFLHGASRSRGPASNPSR